MDAVKIQLRSTKTLCDMQSWIRRCTLWGGGGGGGGGGGYVLLAVHVIRFCTST